MIRRPTRPPRGCWWRRGPLVLAGVAAGACLAGLGPWWSGRSAPRSADLPVAAAPSVTVASERSARPGGRPGTPAQGPAPPPPPRTARPARVVARTFRAVGGPVTATVTVAGAVPGGFPVHLLGPGGAVLAAALAGASPVTLRADVAPATTITLELRAPPSAAVGWQAIVVGAGA